MRLLLTLFIAAAISAALFAAVILVGNFATSGHILPITPEVKVIVPTPTAAPSQPTELAPVVSATTEASATAPTPIAETAPAPAAFDPATYTADATQGEKLVSKCKACHSFGNGEPNKTGPNLFGIVGRTVASHAGFAYSDAMKGKAAELTAWSEEHLFSYLENPKALVPGTKMAFAGLKDPAERLDLIAYLKTLK